MPQEKIGRVVLLISCPDRKGIVAGVSNFIYSIGGNILQSDQYTKGRDLEKTVLARAVHWFLEDRILVYHNRTVVFI